MRLLFRNDLNQSVSDYAVVDLITFLKNFRDRVGFKLVIPAGHDRVMDLGIEFLAPLAERSYSEILKRCFRLIKNHDDAVFQRRILFRRGIDGSFKVVEDRKHHLNCVSDDDPAQSRFLGGGAFFVVVEIRGEPNEHVFCLCELLGFFCGFRILFLFIFFLFFFLFLFRFFFYLSLRLFF